MEQDHLVIGMAVGQIIWIDLVLSCDNAVVIALACRNLPERQRRLGIALGAGTAVVLRIVFAAIIVALLNVPWLKLVGAALLFWIAVKLALPDEHCERDVRPSESIFKAVITIAVADMVMSLDNVIAIAAAANGSIPLLAFGIAISIPMLVVGSAMIMALFQRYPILIWLGVALLGWISGHMIATEPALAPQLAGIPGVVTLSSAAGLIIVTGTAMAAARRRRAMVAGADRLQIRRTAD